MRDPVRPEATYIILLTSKQQKQDVVAGLNSGADDYVTKPFDPQELQSRIRVGERILALQRKLSDRVRKLEEALAQVTELRGLLPMCSYCRKIRNDQNYWQRRIYRAIRTCKSARGSARVAGAMSSNRS